MARSRAKVEAEDDAGDVVVGATRESLFGELHSRLFGVLDVLDEGNGLLVG